MAADSEFVLDAVVGFLTSPVWSSPVLTFMEEKCLVFDPDGTSYEAYNELHKIYKDMVGTLLASFVKDFGITPEQFTEACKDRPDNPTFGDIHRNIFEQIWAADDYEIFKRLMIQKNIEIQLQALRLIEHQGKVKLGQVPASFGSPSAPAMIDEEAIMQEVLRRSKEEYEAQTKSKSGNNELEKAVEESKRQNDRLLVIAKREQEEMEKVLKESIQELKEQRKAEKAAEKAAAAKGGVEKATGNKKAPTSTVTPAVVPSPSSPAAKAPAGKLPAAAQTKKDLSPVVPPPSGAAPPAAKAPAAAATPSDAAANWLTSAMTEAASSTSGSSAGQGSKMSEEELKRRTEYLKQQRDKLLAMKKQERVKNLTKFTEEQPKARPASARAARRATAGESVECTSPDSGDNEKKLAMRRALADVLKREVIEKQ